MDGVRMCDAFDFWKAYARLLFEGMFVLWLGQVEAI